MGTWRRLVVGIVLASGVLATSAMAQEVGPQPAPEQKGPVPPTSAWNGSYTQTIPIEIPEFRGIEPNLSLSYDSARGVRNISAAGGILGIGWSIDGLSAIERISGSRKQATNNSGAYTEDKAPSGRGVPVYNPDTGDLDDMPDDMYVLDGNQLVRCDRLLVPSDSPSCIAPAATANSKFSTRVESYARIRRFVNDNMWELTTKNGTTYTYSGENFIVSAGGSADFERTFRWTISEIKDRDGNIVRFDWQCPVPTIADLTDLEAIQAALEIDLAMQRWIHQVLQQRQHHDARRRGPVVFGTAQRQCLVFDWQDHSSGHAAA